MQWMPFPFNLKKNLCALCVSVVNYPVPSSSCLARHSGNIHQDRHFPAPRYLETHPPSDKLQVTLWRTRSRDSAN